MAKKKEEVVEKTANEPKGDVTKVKAKMKKPAKVIEETITKVDLSKPVETEKVEEVVTVNENPDVAKDIQDETPVIEEIKEETPAVEEKKGEVPALEEITEETAKAENIAEEASEAIKESIETGQPLPENIQKLMSFMEDTGGDIGDYVQLNKDYKELDNLTLLEEYYKQTKPHLDGEEISFLMEDQFSYDEDIEDDKDIKRKKLAMKEQVAQARHHLDGVKSKYYEDIKSGSKLTSEQQEAIEFFNNHNEKSESDNQIIAKNKSTFLDKTNKVFNDGFKGFEYNVGDNGRRCRLS